MENKGIITLIGFVIMGLGFISLILSLIGLKLAFLTWIDAPGPLFGFLIRIVMIITGIITMYIAQVNLEETEEGMN